MLPLTLNRPSTGAKPGWISAKRPPSANWNVDLSRRAAVACRQAGCPSYQSRRRIRDGIVFTTVTVEAEGAAAAASAFATAVVAARAATTEAIAMRAMRCFIAGLLAERL